MQRKSLSWDADMEVWPLAAGALGFVLGLGCGWLLVATLRLRPAEIGLAEARALAQGLEARLAEATSRQTGLEAELERLRGETRELGLELASRRSHGEAAQRALEDLKERLALAQEELQGLRERSARLEAEKKELFGALEAERRAHAARLEELERMGREMEEKFSALATEVLGRNSETFLKLVSERFENHRHEAEQALEARKREIESLLKPLRETLDKFEHRVGEIEKAREGAYRAVLEQVRMLAQSHEKLERSAAGLVQALRRPQVRGRWGEYQLRNVVELAGMSEHVDFVLQPQTGTADLRLRPDAVVRLPGGKTVVVDAKTPLDAYLEAVEAESEEQRQLALDRHARQLRQHVQLLAAKEYWRQLSEAPDFVVMFVPGEAFYAAALERDPTLFEDALRRRVLVATPTTFVALMKAIAYGWQQEKIAESAEKVATAGRELHSRLRVFLEHVDKLGRALGSAIEQFNRAVGSLEGRVLPQARRLEELGVTPQGENLPRLEPVERAPRPLATTEAASGEAAGR